MVNGRVAKLCGPTSGATQMAGEEAAMAFGGRACSMTTVPCGATPNLVNVIIYPNVRETGGRVSLDPPSMARFLPAKAVEDHRKYQEHLRLGL